MTFFLVIDLFHVLISYFSVGGEQICSDIGKRGGQNPYILPTYFTLLTLLVHPPRGPNSIANFEGGVMAAGLAPLDPPLNVRAMDELVTKC